MACHSCPQSSTNDCHESSRLIRTSMMGSMQKRPEVMKERPVVLHRLEAPCLNPERVPDAHCTRQPRAGSRIAAVPRLDAREAAWSPPDRGDRLPGARPCCEASQVAGSIRFLDASQRLLQHQVHISQGRSGILTAVKRAAKPAAVFWSRA